MKSVTISDATLLTLSKRANVRKRVPVLNAVFNALNGKGSPGRRRCGTCAKRAKLSQAVIAARSVLAQQPAALIALKQILGADQLVLYVKGPKGLTQRKVV